MTTVTAVIPAHRPRVKRQLHRALDSVLMQNRAVDAISVAVDKLHEGAAVTRNRALACVTTDWTAFLDSDDTWYPEHIGSLLACAQETGADMVYPWFEVINGWDPFPEREGRPFNPELLDHQNTIPITVLIRTELIRTVGGFTPKGPPDNPCDDWGAWIKVRDAGAKIVHLNRRTWAWHWGDNTGGRGDRW